MAEKLVSKPEPELIQQEPICLEDLSPYRGRWVMLKNGHVTSHSENAAVLVPDGTLPEDSMLLFVPTHDTFILGAKRPDAA